MGTECAQSRTQSNFSPPAVFTDKPALEYEVRKHCNGHMLPQTNMPDTSLAKFRGRFLTSCKDTGSFFNIFHLLSGRGKHDV